MGGPIVYTLALSPPWERTEEISEVLGNELESLILFSRIQVKVNVKSLREARGQGSPETAYRNG